jgi:hypothetical protein
MKYSDTPTRSGGQLFIDFGMSRSVQLSQPRYFPEQRVPLAEKVVTLADKRIDCGEAFSKRFGSFPDQAAVPFSSKPLR